MKADLPKEQIRKWRGNQLKIRRQEAEDCYKLWKALKKVIKIDCGYNPSLDFCLRIDTCKIDEKGAFGKCVNCEKKKALLGLEAKLLKMIADPDSALSKSRGQVWVRRCAFRKSP